MDQAANVNQQVLLPSGGEAGFKFNNPSETCTRKLSTTLPKTQMNRNPQEQPPNNGVSGQSQTEVRRQVSFNDNVTKAIQPQSSSVLEHGYRERRPDTQVRNAIINQNTANNGSYDKTKYFFIRYLPYDNL